MAKNRILNCYITAQHSMGCEGLETSLKLALIVLKAKLCSTGEGTK